MSSPTRRVAIGKDATGKAIAILDPAATAVHRREELGVTNTLLWVLDTIPANLSNPAELPAKKAGGAPPPEDSIFRVIEFPPGKEMKADGETRLQIFQGLGLAPEGESRDKPRDQTMQRRGSIDYALILSGEIDMLLDDSEIHLKQGDIVIQRGMNHTWVNRGDAPCQVAFVLVDAKE